MYMYMYMHTLACVIFLLNFTFWEETTNRMKAFPKTHQAPVLGEDRSCGLRVPPTQLGKKDVRRRGHGGTWGDMGDVCWRCLVWPLNVTRLLQKWMAGNRPHGCRIWYDHIHYLFWLKLVHLNSQRTKSGHFFHELPVWQTPNSSVLHCLLRAPTINPTPLPKSRLSSGTQNQILSLTFEATDARLSRILYSSSGF